MSWAIQLPATAAVVYMVVFLIPRFLKALETMGKRWDEERVASREEAKEERRQFAEMMSAKEQAWADERAGSQEALMATIGLAHKMVDNCQEQVPLANRVSANDVCHASGSKTS